MSRLPSSAPSSLVSSADTCLDPDSYGPAVISAGAFSWTLLRLRRCREIARGHDFIRSRHARPVVAGAEEAADRAGLDAQRVGLLEGHPGVIAVAAGTAVDVA